MNRQKTLLFVGAHPDDESFGVGGTLAQYAAAGVKVYYACGTRGEVGMVAPELMKGYVTVGDLRWYELQCAAKILGLADVIYLGYRDSGMLGTEDNKHPQALAAASQEEVVGRIVKVIRNIKPDVVVTFDPIGGYRHPDHIAIHEATTKAFYAAADPKQFAGAGEAFQSRKLYYSVFPRGFLKMAVRLMSLFGRDSHHFGRNKDIDLAKLAEVQFPVHAIVRLKKSSAQARREASACHMSQLAGGPLRRGFIWRIAGRFTGAKDLFMRAYPPVTSRRRETDLFQGIN
jgi:N-acetyl-1-D-myo-inositol-2-amino-2-deoxy-alpha-D-glucopyranoside deacetylase